MSQLKTTDKVIQFFKEHPGASANDCAKYLAWQNGSTVHVSNVCNILNKLALKGIINIPQGENGKSIYTQLTFN